MLKNTANAFLCPQFCMAACWLVDLQRKLEICFSFLSAFRIQLGTWNALAQICKNVLTSLGNKNKSEPSLSLSSPIGTLGCSLCKLCNLPFVSVFINSRRTLLPYHDLSPYIWFVLSE